MNVTIFRCPDRRTSRNALAMIRNAGIELEIIKHFKFPPDRNMRKNPVACTGAQGSHPANLKWHTVCRTHSWGFALELRVITRQASR
ncbi:hypothetical protein QMN58_32690, partial [Escherichia coli]|nr:hypothetical protein [Escherichia coli]